jgi:hypothetical protein
VEEVGYLKVWRILIMLALFRLGVLYIRLWRMWGR